MRKFKGRFDNIFHNLPDQELADQFGDAAEAKARHSALRREILRRGLADASGTRYTVTVSQKPTTVFNHERCREALGDEAYLALWERADSPWVQSFPAKKKA
jgi:hypothetical protein